MQTAPRLQVPHKCDTHFSERSPPGQPPSRLMRDGQWMGVRESEQAQNGDSLAAIGNPGQSVHNHGLGKIAVSPRIALQSLKRSLFEILGCVHARMAAQWLWEHCKMQK